MPRTAVDYSKTIIYKIVCNDLTITDLYVGSTTDFTRRKNCHKTRCNNLKDKCYNLKIYKTIRDNGGWLNWTIVQIEEFPCVNGNEARARERYFYEQLNSTLNTVYPQRNLSEYYISYNEKNKNKISEKNKKYREANKDKIKEYKKEYVVLHKDDKYTCECGSVCILNNKRNHFKTKKHINYLNLQKENI
jgi:hypothetical protein